MPDDHPVKPLVTRPSIFSGDGSREFWRELNDFNDFRNVQGRDLWSFLYTLGCKLQELESRVESAGLEKGKMNARGKYSALPTSADEFAERKEPNPVQVPSLSSATRPYGCKCQTLAHKLTGVGCDECNPIQISDFLFR